MNRLSLKYLVHSKYFFLPSCSPLDDLLRALSSPFSHHGGFCQTATNSAAAEVGDPLSGGVITVIGASASSSSSSIPAAEDSSASSAAAAASFSLAIPGDNEVMTRWLNLVLVIVRQLLQIDEDVVLARLKVRN